MIYDLKNFISFDYIKKELLKLNKKYPEFTKTPILINIDIFQNEFIHLALLNKSILTSFSKTQINEYLFNITCEKLGWFNLI